MKMRTKEKRKKDPQLHTIYTNIHKTLFDSSNKSMLTKIHKLENVNLCSIISIICNVNVKEMSHAIRKVLQLLQKKFYLFSKK